MMSFLPAPLTGLICIVLYVFNTLIWLIPILFFSLLKAILPIKLLSTYLTHLLDLSASSWVAVNTFIQRLFTPVEIDCEGLNQLSTKEWYLVLSNHQSWVDILVLQRVFSGRIPFLKFFLKKELIWVPLLGLAWWALEFPFMKRYSREFLAKHPHLRGKDIETTRLACEKFKVKPVSVMNFVEGTRFTKRKHDKQGSNFKSLLNPRAGGIAFALNAMGEHFTYILDVSIYYPDGVPTFWQYVSGTIKRVKVSVKILPVEQHLIGDYFNDMEFKNRFQHWVNNLWLDKDRELSRLAAHGINKE